MRNKCARTLSLLSLIVFIGLSSSMAAEIPVVRGQLHPPAQELVQDLFVVVEEGSTHTEIPRAIPGIALSRGGSNHDAHPLLYRDNATARRAELRQETSARAAAEPMGPACCLRTVGQPALPQQLTWSSSLRGKWPIECQFLCSIGMQFSIDIHE